MTDVAPDTGTDATEITERTAAATAGETEFQYPTNTPVAEMTVEQQAEYWRDKAQKHEKQWKSVSDKTDADLRKQLSTTRKQLESLQKASMTEQEHAVAEAKVVGRQEALIEVGGRLAAAEVRVAAAGRLDSDQLATLLDGIDLARFLTDDGEVDTAKVTAFVDGIAPKPTDGQSTPLDLGQGARGGPTLNSDDPLLRDVTRLVG